MARLDFSYLGFPVIWAILLLEAVPDTTTMLGTVLIGVAVLWGVLRRPI